MGFQACNTGSLDLGLGLTANSQESCSPTPPNKSHHPMRKAATSFEPSLTLGLSGNSFHEDDHLQGNNNSVHELYNRQSGSPHNSHSAVSNSFSSGGRVVKRERDLSSEEAEVEKLSGRAVSDEDEDGPNARKKLRLTKDQSALLEESFTQHSTLNPKQKQALARQLSLTPRQVEVWFQNRRARTKLKQTEVDCELLKKCCENLTDENRRLQKEVQELKALKQQQQHPLFMHMPAATLTMCPSCERIGSGVGSEAAANSNKIPFSMAHPKPHFYNPFTNSSAAC